MLKIRDLTVIYGETRILNRVSIDVKRSEIVGIVGESGSGKSTLLNSIIDLLDPKLKIAGGDIIFEDHILSSMKKKEWNKIRGQDISFISQYPVQSLDPVFKIRSQIREILPAGKSDMERVRVLLQDLGFEDPDRILDSYPFELSGGMCQRVAIAMALCSRTKLLLADEPTSALDITIQADIIKMLTHIRKEYGLAILIASHNMGVISKMADRVAVMYQGEVVEFGDTQDVTGHPSHPYTKKLIASIPKM